MSLSSQASLSPAPGVTRRTLAWCEARRWLLAVSAAMVGWSLSLFVLVRSAYESFELGRFDLGNMVQAVWSTAQGRPLESTTAVGEQLSRLSGHVDPILVLITPLWVLFPSPLTLAAVQIAAVSLGALPVFWLARKHLGSERAAAFLAFAYLASPWIAWTTYDAIHPKTFAIPLFLFAVWFLDEDRLGAFAVVAVLAAACGELMGMTIAALGVWYALARGRRLAGLVIAAAGAAWTAIAVLAIIPAFAGEESQYYRLYAAVGGSPAGLVKTVFTDPMAVVAAMTETTDVLYVFLLATPLLGTFLLAPALAAVALPQLAVNALADAGGPVDPRHHYIAAIVPFLFAASAIGLARVDPRKRSTLACAVLAMSLVLTVLLGPWPGLERVPIRYEVHAPPGRADVLRRAVTLVPDGVPVSASQRVGAHLAEREYLYTVPIVRNAEWIVVDTTDHWISYDGLPYLAERPASEILAFRARIAASDRWVTVFDEAGVSVFRRADG